MSSKRKVNEPSTKDDRPIPVKADGSDRMSKLLKQYGCGQLWKVKLCPVPPLSYD